MSTVHGWTDGFRAHVDQILHHVPADLVNLCLEYAGPDVFVTMGSLTVGEWPMEAHSLLMTPPLTVVGTHARGSAFHTHVVGWMVQEHPYFENVLRTFTTLLQQVLADYSAAALRPLRPLRPLCLPSEYGPHGACLRLQCSGGYCALCLSDRCVMRLKLLRILLRPQPTVEMQIERVLHVYKARGP